MTRAVQRIFFLLCPQCNLRVSPIIVGTVSFVFLQQTIHSHMKFDGQSQNTSTWVIIYSETYCIFKILCFLVLVGCFEGFFLNQWKNSAIFQGLSGLLVLPYFYECNRWLHRFLPHTDCSREHLTVQHLKRTPHPGLTGRWNSSVSCSVNFELLKTVDCVWCQFLVNAIVLLNLLNESLKSLLKLRIECTILKFTVTGPRGNIKKGGKKPPSLSKNVWIWLYKTGRILITLI